MNDICLELQLGLALPRNTTPGFDLNSHTNEAAASVNHNHHDDSPLSSTCTSDFSEDTKHKKRGIGRAFENCNEDINHRRFDCHTVLPFLSLTPNQPDEDFKYPRDYEGHSDKASNSTFVKVKMEGMAIARKVDLSLYHSVQKLKETLMDMFGKWQEHPDSYKLTYQDMEGDWLLAEDVPWMGFIQSVQRLELVKNIDGMN